MQVMNKRAPAAQSTTSHNQIAKDQRARSSEPLYPAALHVLDARQWTRLVHLSQARKRFFKILAPFQATLLSTLGLTKRRMTIEGRINSIGDSIRLLVRRLAERGFIFERPVEVFPGPEAGTEAAIARIESEVGAVPLALKLFWLNVGSVDLCGFHPGWTGCEDPDALVVLPPSFAIHELMEFMSDKDERLQCNFPYLIPISPDHLHKIHVSGGMWYNVSVPAVADDPPLNDEWHKTTFVAYLEEAVRWAGFPGLSECPGHLWPIEELLGNGGMR